MSGRCTQRGRLGGNARCVRHLTPTGPARSVKPGTLHYDPGTESENHREYKHWDVKPQKPFLSDVRGLAVPRGNRYGFAAHRRRCAVETDQVGTVHG